MKRLLFLHIHKTGGTSITRMLRANFRADEICPYPFEWQILQASVEELRRYRFFAGHISPKSLLDKVGGLDVVTFLREPHARLVSAYKFWHAMGQARNESAQPPVPETIRRIGEMDFREFIGCSRLADCVDNVQYRLLHGARFGGTNERRIMVEGALTGRLPLSFIGTLENITADLPEMFMQLGFPRPEHIAHENVGSSSAVAAEVEPERMRAVTVLDSKLHAWAQSRGARERDPES